MWCAPVTVELLVPVEWQRHMQCPMLRPTIPPGWMQVSETNMGAGAAPGCRIGVGRQVQQGCKFGQDTTTRRLCLFARSNTTYAVGGMTSMLATVQASWPWPHSPCWSKGRAKGRQATAPEVMRCSPSWTTRTDEATCMPEHPCKPGNAVPPGSACTSGCSIPPSSACIPGIIAPPATTCAVVSSISPGSACDSESTCTHIRLAPGTACANRGSNAPHSSWGVGSCTQLMTQMAW